MIYNILNISIQANVYVGDSKRTKPVNSPEIKSIKCNELPMNVSTHIMDEFSLQETDRFQRQEVVHQEGVGVFQSTDDTPEDEVDVCMSLGLIQ